jgi:PAS domain S-box-containing protein
MIRLSPRSLSARIAAGVVATLLVIGGGSFWVLQAFYRRQMISSLADSTTVHGKLVEQSLRYAMHTRSLALLAEMVRSLGDQRGVEKVMILNKRGVIRFSSDPAEQGKVLARSDRTCMICHATAPSERGRTVIFSADDGRRVFRNVNPIFNSETCYGCHPAADRINGILLVDYSMAGIEASLRAGARKMWLSAVTLALAVAGVIVLLLRRLVLDRLRRMVSAVDRIEAGDLTAPVDVGGHDEITLLAQHLKRMARSLDESLRDLRHREGFLDAVINSATDGIVVVDETLRVVASNRAFAAISTISGEELAAVPCECAPCCRDRGAADCPARETFRTGEATHRLRSVAAPDGTVRSYEIAAAPLREGGGPRQAIEVWRDITDRRALEAQLASTERLASLGLLAAGVSHELNNPLASITTCLDGLRRRLGGVGEGRWPDELPEYLDLIRGEVDRCRELGDRLRALIPRSRRERAHVDVGGVVRDTVALLRYTAEQERVEIEVEVAPDLAAVTTDEPQLRQVVLNLLLNAVQASEGAGRVAVSARTVDHLGVEIEVVDGGRGIEPDDLPHIFEPFFSKRADGLGTGLGLFISKVIIDRLGGSIAVTSTPGEGARFTVRLPADARPEEGVAE